MNIRMYLPWKKFTNIWTNEYIRLNIFEYIRISEYSSHTGVDQEYPKPQFVLKNGKNHPKRKNSKTSRNMPK